jgi:hypothetical protein
MELIPFMRQLDAGCADILAHMPAQHTPRTDLARRSRRGRDWQTLAASMSYDHRTRIGTLARGLHEELLEDAGPDLSAARRLALSCLTYATVSLFQVEREADGTLSQESGELARQWLTTVQKYLGLIGLDRVPRPAIDLGEYIDRLAIEAEPAVVETDTAARPSKKPASARSLGKVRSSRPKASRPSAPAARRRAGLPSAPPGPPVLTVVATAIEDEASQG